MAIIKHPAEGNRLGRILVVDDEAQVRKPISIMLAKDGYEVVEAADGQEAIEALRSGDNPLMVDTVLCDIRMPNINGKEAIVYFRSQFPGVPIVVMTGYPDVELAVSLMRQGVRDYLIKPVTKEELLSVIRKSVDQHVVLKDQFAV
ncbi:MAG TPA: response regulator [Nitrospiraceae bacterium]|jgi:two-component system chemotaxis response regulator CheY|nr:response regulator [Nitrospiraceae bacterium]